MLSTITHRCPRDILTIFAHKIRVHGFIKDGARKKKKYRESDMLMTMIDLCRVQSRENKSDRIYTYIHRETINHRST